MDFELTEEQKQIKALVREFCKREVDQKRMLEILNKNDAAKTIEEIRANYPHDLEEKAHNAGLLTIGIPTKYGGPGPDTEPNMAITIAKEEAGYSAGLAAWFLVGPDFTVQAMRANPYFTDEQRKQRFAKDLEYSRVKKTVSHSITDPGGPGGSGGVDIHLPYDEGGSQILQVTARKDGDEWVINGDKMYSNDGAMADYHSLTARTKDGPISESLTSFTGIKADAPGVTRILNKLIFTCFGGNCQWYFDNVRVPDSAVVGQVHQAWKQTAFAFQYKWQVRSMGIDILRSLLEHMREYAKQRVGGGKPIIQHSSVAAKLGYLATQLEALRNLQYRAAWENDQMETYMEKTGYAIPPVINMYWYSTLLTFQKKVSFEFFEGAHDIYGSLAGSEDIPVESFLRWNFMWRGAAMPPDMAAARATKDYDDRFYYRIAE